MVQQDGERKHDGERQAAQRLVATRRQDHPPLTCLVTEESVSATAPPMETRHDHQRHSLLGVTEGDQAVRCRQGQAAEPGGRVTYSERHDRAAGLVHRCRWVNDVPRNASHAEGRVNVIA